MRETLFVVLAIPTAPVRSSGPTISCTNDDRTGVSKELTVPIAAANTNRLQTRMVSVTTMTPSAVASSPASTCVVCRILQRLSRSASAPANAPSSSVGMNCTAVTRPRSSPRPVRCSTNHPMATVCIQVPVCETPCPIR